jgi:ATP-dependent RNA helicase DHX37/DHR1
MLQPLQKDDVRCHVRGTFGPHRWPLPAGEVSYPVSPERFKLFAQALLEGSVFSQLKEFVPHLKNQPNIVTKPWSKVWLAHRPL